MQPSPDFGYQRLPTRTAARNAFDTLTESVRHGLTIYDHDIGHYGLDRAAVAERFDRLLRSDPEIRIELLLREVGSVRTDCPRLMNLVMRHGPRLSIRAVAAGAGSYSRGLALFDDSVVLRRPDLQRMTTLFDTDAGAVAATRRLLAELAEDAGPPLSPVVTGL